MTGAIVLALTFLGTGGDAPDSAAPRFRVRVTGEARLQCRSRWHQLDMPLHAKSRATLPLDARKIFAVPAGARPGESWTLPADLAAGLIAAIDAVPWTPQDPAEYEKWIGSQPNGFTKKIDAKLTLTLKQAGDRRRVEFTGTGSVTEEGKLASRFGPNTLHAEGRHSVRGSVELDADGYPVALHLTDAVEVEGRFYTEAAVDIGEPYTRKATLTLREVPSRPLSAAEKQQVAVLITRLGADAFRTRESATKALLQLARANDRVADMIRDTGLSHPEPEVQSRAARVLREIE